jgi:two-component system response regulator QseB
MASILVVDDDIHMGESFKFTLVRQGNEVFFVQRGDEAMHLVQTIKPQVVFIDLHLPTPDIPGLELIGLIRDCTDCGDPILIAVTAGSDHDIAAALEAGCVDVLRKPFLPRELLALVQQYTEN